MTTIEPQHSPTPWTRHLIGQDIRILADDGSRVAAKLLEADADLIIKCVSQHNALVAALEAAASLLSDLGGADGLSAGGKAKYAKIRAALNLA